MMKTAKHIDITNVTPEQIGRCYKLYDCQTKSNFYQVESESGPDTYNVRWSRERGFTCTCPAGAVAFTRCKNGYCKHVAWAVAAAREEREALAELSAAQDARAAIAAGLIVNGKPADAATVERVYSAKPAVSDGEPYSPRPFSLLA